MAYSFIGKDVGLSSQKEGFNSLIGRQNLTKYCGTAPIDAETAYSCKTQLGHYSITTLGT
jgi:hypothetical protein